MRERRQLELFRQESRKSFIAFVPVLLVILSCFALVLLPGCTAQFGEHADGRNGISIFDNKKIVPPATSTVTRNPPADEVEDEKSDSTPKEPLTRL